MDEDRRTRIADMAAAAAIFVVAAVMFFAARLEPASRFDPLGPGTAPMAVAGALAILAAILFIRAALGLRIGHSTQSLILGVDGAGADYKLRPGLAWLALAVTAAYAAAISWDLSFLWSTMAFLLVLGVAMGDRTKRHLVTAVAVAVIGALAIDFLFRRIFFIALN